jgi:hypothetical protein
VPLISATLTEFKLLSEDDVIKLIQGPKSTTCELDVIPTQKLKDNLHYLIPVLTEIINRSLSSGVFPKDWKNAVIKPLLKKKGLPLEQNFRTIGLCQICPFCPKSLRNLPYNKLLQHIEINSLLPSYQSAYRHQ